MSLFANLTIEDLITLSRAVGHDRVMLSNCKTRAVVKGDTGTILSNKLSLKTSCTHRCDVVVEWLS